MSTPTTVREIATANNKVYLLTHKTFEPITKLLACDQDAEANLKCKVSEMSGVSK